MKVLVSLRWASVAACIALLVLLSIGYLGRWVSFLDIVTHFRMQYVAAFGILLVIFLIQRMWRWVVVATLSLVVASPGIVRYFIPRVSGCASKPFRLLSYNVFTPNENKDGVLRLVRSVDADLILLIEVDQKWQQAFNAFSGEYPFSLWVPRDDNFGIGVLSRVKPERLEERYFGQLGVPSIVIEAQTADLSFVLVGTHTMPPYNPALSRHRDAQLVDVAEFLSGTGRGDIILAGDLNITPWSAPMRGLRQRGLQDARMGHGISPTWMRWNPLVAIPLDHILIGPELWARRVAVLDSNGSDHNAVLVEVCRRAALQPSSSASAYSK